jgi:hypothetical protein
MTPGNRLLFQKSAKKARYITAHDADFNILKNIPFQRVNVLTLQQLIQIITPA